MNEHYGGPFFVERKPGLYVASDRMSHQPMSRPHNPYFSRERNNGYSMGPHHVHHRSRGRGFNDLLSYRYASQPTGIPLKPNGTLLRPNPSSNDSSSRTGYGKDQPATFVCQGIEVDFESSTDSEEEVRPWEVVKVLKKKGSQTENAPVVVGSLKAEDTRQKVIPCAQRKILAEHDTLGKDESDEVQVLSPAPSDTTIVRETSKRPSGSRKRTESNTFQPINNCAIIKCPRFLFSQQVPRPPIRPPPQPRFSVPAPCCQEKPLSPPSGLGDLTVEELRIIEDVLDMEGEIEMRAGFSDYRYF